jgi:diacylglycerol kinase family enzyme
MKYFLVLNPGSKGGKSQKTFQKIFQLLMEAQINFDFGETKTLDDAYRLSVEANSSAYDVIVAVGGDGTINKVLNGFFNQEGKRRSGAKMGVIYTGTSPDFCKSYNIPVASVEAIKVLINDYSRPIYLGKLLCSYERIRDPEIHYVSEIDNKMIRYFACCANIGLGATLARKANGGIRKYLGDQMGTFVSMLSTLVSYNANEFNISVEGVEKKIDSLYNMSIGRTKYIASGIKVPSKINFSERGFYLLSIQNLDVLKLIKTIRTVYGATTIQNSDYLSFSHIAELEVLNNIDNPEVEMDGDPIGFLPCCISTSDDTLDLIVQS